jgi:hypothetical protein
VLSQEHYNTLNANIWVDGTVIYSYTSIIREQSKDPQIKTHPRHFLSFMFGEDELAQSKGYKFIAGRSLFRQVRLLLSLEE